MANFHEKIHSARINKFVGRLKNCILGDYIPLNAEFGHSKDPVPFDKRLELDYREIKEGESWGDTWDSAWFHLKAEVPSEWKGCYVVARLNFAGEACIFDRDGVPVYGLANGSVFDADYAKDVYHLFPECEGGENVDLWVEAAANALFGVSRCREPLLLEDTSKLHGHHRGKVEHIRLHKFDYAMWQMWLDAAVLHNLLDSLPKDSVRFARLLRGLSKAADLHAGGHLERCGAELKKLLDVPADPAGIDVTGVGHAHIDTGWLWPIRETIRKSARTFSSQIDLIERYPDYVFGASQPAHYKMVKEHYPALYDKIKKAVKEGRWECQGGMWVEADCNIISGESMIRQFIHGKNFFKDEFDVEVKNLWLPDVFGYSANLPQILKRAGIDYFLTQKLSWSNYNTFPHTTFVWRGIDGSEVLTHFPPEDTYNAGLWPGQLRRDETNNKDKGVVNDALCLFGIGDGGGGPKEEYLERGLRVRNLNGLPKFSFGAGQPVLEKIHEVRDELDVWVGELYLELHRGTLTTQSATKRLNRRLEDALRACEMVCTAAGLETYPLEKLDETWKTLLINQFHDILPGSSIHWVYEENVRDLQAGIDTCRELMNRAAEQMFEEDESSLVLFNPSTTPYTGIIQLPDGWKGAVLSGEILPAVQEEGNTSAAVTVPGQSFITLSREDGNPADAEISPAGDETVLENELVRYEFDCDGCLIRGFDKECGIEIIGEGEIGNLLTLYLDRPHNWDAWDVDEFYMNEIVQTAAASSLEKVVMGDVCSGLNVELTVGNSKLTQKIRLENGTKRLDFITEADWNEDHKMLRVSFPVTVNVPEAAFEVQYGFITRPAHDNTMWDRAKFEVVGHRWADLSRPDYGVALLNDCKYGYNVKDGVLDLNLLRAPTEPDPVADIGHHSFTYSLYPHRGNAVQSDIWTHAAILNQGIESFPGFRASEDAGLPVSLEGEGAELAVCKKGEKEECVIARIVETRGMKRTCTLRASGKSIVETGLMEWNEIGETADNEMNVNLNPFEIRTFKIR